MYSIFSTNRLKLRIILLNVKYNATKYWIYLIDAVLSAYITCP